MNGLLFVWMYNACLLIFQALYSLWFDLNEHSTIKFLVKVCMKNEQWWKVTYFGIPSKGIPRVKIVECSLEDVYASTKLRIMKVCFTTFTGQK